MSLFGEYKANPLHAAGFIALGAVFGAIGVGWQRGGWVLYTAAGMCLVGVIVVFLSLIWQHEINRWTEIGFASEKIAMLDDHRFQVLGMTFPKVRVRWSNGLKPVPMFDDCEVATTAHLAIFLNGSDSRQVFPKRYWYGEKEFRGGIVTLSDAAYKEILNNLIARRLVVKDSAAGSHSWLWKEMHTFANLRRYWHEWIFDNRTLPNIDHIINNGAVHEFKDREIPNMDEMEAEDETEQG